MATIPYVRATHVDGQSAAAAKINVLEAGVNDVSYAPAVRVYHNTTQSINASTETTVAFNSERIDQAGNAADTMHDTVTNNSRLTCRYAGVYFIMANIAWASAPTSSELNIRLGGATYIGSQSFGAVGRCQVSTVYPLAVNEYVEFRATQVSGGAINIVATGNWTPEFMMVRIA